MAFPTRRVAGFFAVFVLGVGALFALYTTVVLNWSYSTGDRAGTLLKIAEKGWVCKTWAGELVMPLLTTGGDGSADQNDIGARTWYFTVTDEAVVKKVQRAVGKRVVLTYDEHKGVPSSCFGDTKNFVSDVRIEEPLSPTPSPAPPPTPAPVPTPEAVPVPVPAPMPVPTPATP